GVGIGVDVGHAGFRAPRSRRGEEPKPIFLDRATDSAIEVINGFDGVDGRQSFVAQSVVQIVALESIRGPGQEQRAVYTVAAVLGDGVHLRAAEGVFGRSHGARIDDYFLDRQRVDVVTAPSALETANAGR